ncbi:MAG TPA: DUF1800 family protein [Stellaceae bacterium]
MLICCSRPREPPGNAGLFERRPVDRPRLGRGINRGKGLNENFAREILELHTLGVRTDAGDDPIRPNPPQPARRVRGSLRLDAAAAAGARRRPRDPRFLAIVLRGASMGSLSSPRSTIPTGATCAAWTF